MPRRAESLTSSQIAALDDALDTCFSQGDPVALDTESECLPYALGADQRNQTQLEVVYFCSDLCPENGGVWIVYQDVQEADCQDLGGEPVQDFAFGIYIGCVPPELT